MANYLQKNHRKRFLNKFSILFLTVLFIPIGLSCGGSKPSRFYTLSTTTTGNDTSVEISDTDIVVGVGPIKFPDYLMRPQIAIHTSRNELSYDEFNRWAEPLDENFARILTENLSQEIPTDKIVHFPWRASSFVKYQIVIEVVQFAQKADNRVHLVARWQVLEDDNRGNTKILLSKKSAYSEAAPAMVKDEPDYDQVVAIMSGLVGKLSLEMAEGVRKSAAE